MTTMRTAYAEWTDWGQMMIRLKGHNTRMSGKSEALSGLTERTGRDHPSQAILGESHRAEWRSEPLIGAVAAGERGSEKQTSVGGDVMAQKFSLPVASC